MYQQSATARSKILRQTEPQMTTPPNPRTRRDFLHTSLAFGAAWAGGMAPAVSSAWAGAQSTPATASGGTNGKPLNILVLGGTAFIGPAFIEMARKHGHSISVFNRGITEKRKGSLGDGIERLVGDRDPDKGDGLKSLEGKSWDVVIDNSGFYPRHVKASAQLLAPNIKHYLFVSSISAYARNDRPNVDETSALATIPDPAVETMGNEGEFYGGLKVLCEQAAEAAMPGKTTIVRPGFIVGPDDGSDRFTYCPWRVQQGGEPGRKEMAAPGEPENPMQIIDVRDLAAFMLLCAEKTVIETFNVCGLAKPITVGELIATSQKVVTEMGGTPAEPTWINTKFLKDCKEPVDFTIWIPDTGETAGFHRVSNDRAVKAGLTFTPLAKTIRDTLEWFPKEQERRIRVTKEIIDAAKAKGEPPPKVEPTPGEIRAGLKPEQEAALLKAWRDSQTAG